MIEHRKQTLSEKPTIGITMGDPNGIGPEIIIKSLLCSEVQNQCLPIVYGDSEILNEAKKLTGFNNKIDITNVTNLSFQELSIGRSHKLAGMASIEYIKAAVESALVGKLDAIVTAPISKESIHLAGSNYPGHTEMLRDLTGASNVAMMFVGGEFRIVLVTIHCALSDVPKLINEEKILDSIKLANDSLIQYFRVEDPRIVVCGLNPHAGESGAFGNEEALHILPAVKKAKRMGINVIGPIAADTLFYMARKGRWDAVIAMYHDQGLIPFKMLFFEHGVNVTLGLPIIRTSPDHGTAFDIAWKGNADPSSMISAIGVALELAKNRREMKIE